MIYTWHRTVRLFSCCFALLFITVVIYGTDLILYNGHIVYVSPLLCGTLIPVFTILAAFMPHNNPDPLSILCGLDVPLKSRYEFLQNGNSKCASFYRWVKKIKIQWNIEEEKLIITTIFGLITSIFVIIMSIYVLVPDYSFEIK